MPEYSWPERARKIGVDSFWYKDGQKESILDLMECTMAGECIYPDETPLIHIGNTTNRDFTQRELEILKELTAVEEKPVSLFRRVINTIKGFFAKIADFFKNLFRLK